MIMFVNYFVASFVCSFVKPLVTLFVSRFVNPLGGFFVMPLFPHSPSLLSRLHGLLDKLKRVLLLLHSGVGFVSCSLGTGFLPFSTSCLHGRDVGVDGVVHEFVWISCSLTCALYGSEQLF